MGHPQQAFCVAAPSRSLPPLFAHLVLLFTFLLIAASTTALPFLHASPIRVPDLRQCKIASETDRLTLIRYQFNCCLPIPATKAVDFSFAAYPPQKHVRQPAHMVGEDYIAKYRRAYELMRALPDDDPRSFYTQANIHCAFCSGAYRQAGNESLVLQMHFSWLFLPWHRWYLYFHERILGSLLGDPSFSLVFWNWDDQCNGGYVMPAMFVEPGTALDDAKRNSASLPPKRVNLALSSSRNDSELLNANLNAMYQAVVTANTAELFLGGAYRTGTDVSDALLLNVPLGGSIENGVHNAIHYWTGDSKQPLRQDMGSFSTAARDPIFYAHHSNIDRLWDVWHTLPGGSRIDHTDFDFLNAEFYFYDENANLVKVKVCDALDNSKLGVSYPSILGDEQWINYSPRAITQGSAVTMARASGVREIGAMLQKGKVLLEDQLVVIVKRPIGEKPSNKQEVLVIQGLEVRSHSFVALLVFVNLPSASASTLMSSAEYVGNFNIIPTASNHKHLMANAKFEIGDNLRRIGIQNEEEVIITLVNKGTNSLTIQGLVIEYE